MRERVASFGIKFACFRMRHTFPSTIRALRAESLIIRALLRVNENERDGDRERKREFVPVTFPKLSRQYELTQLAIKLLIASLIATPRLRGRALARIAQIEFLETNGSLCSREGKQIAPGHAVFREISLFLGRKRGEERGT